ncbi:DUF1788 domain-containing protein [Gordonia pseudamarae]|jgi:hypothetical protein|uniref:DUF1788 domain-containing protein n=1 Tax=Gordonia pseudamarae TaxID=2831662 RepID=A0ABX6INF3_9ACTN|nr:MULTISPECIES: DUF1788 domain-containing protein [Gordonia]MBD0020769.1 DUF1788 domain-containing protein [Gordonia sp. (in: high G+C Gram-positive bacteria)]QHN27803.1 DUF1788 domain-containing protein [Gordonia pseudamarae]QHN36685.1 DUF1788 domain-containing protein [Gordonia pseudamarae]
MTTAQRNLAHDEKHVYDVLRSDRFLKMEGLSKEVPFFIYHFPPAWSLEVDGMRDRVSTKLRSDDGISVVDIDLYELAVQLLTERGVWERVLAAEPTMDKVEFREMLQGMLDPHDHLAPAIRTRLDAEPTADSHRTVVFLTGIGEVFPFIRTHTVLENLQSVVVGRPLLVWFPGTYEFTQSAGHQLRALNLGASDSYYRAKDILEQEA